MSQHLSEHETERIEQLVDDHLHLPFSYRTQTRCVPSILSNRDVKYKVTVKQPKSVVTHGCAQKHGAASHEGWPATSPNLNPIEQVSAQVIRRVAIRGSEHPQVQWQKQVGVD